jgi:hypothetical protein
MPFAARVEFLAALREQKQRDWLRCEQRGVHDQRLGGGVELRCVPHFTVNCRTIARPFRLAIVLLSCLSRKFAVNREAEKGD